jgi:hypothetical protein
LFGLTDDRRVEPPGSSLGVHVLPHLPDPAVLQLEHDAVVVVVVAAVSERRLEPDFSDNGVSIGV